MNNKIDITMDEKPNEINYQVQIRGLMDRIKVLENNNDGQRHIDIERDLKDLYAMVNILQKKEELKPYLKLVF